MTKKVTPTSSNDHHYDTRLALLEQSIVHINETLNRFEKRFDALDTKLDSIDKKFETKIDNLDKKFDARFDKLDSRFFYLLGLFIAGFGTLAGLMAHGFHWY